MVRVFLAVRTGIGGGGRRGVVGVVRVFAIGLDDSVMVVMGFAIVVVAAAVTAAIRWAMGWAMGWALGRTLWWALWRAFGWTMVFWWARLTRGWTTGSRFGIARGIGRRSTVGMALVVGWAVRRRRVLFGMRWPTRRHRNRFQAKLLAIARWPREQHPQPQAYVIIRAMRSAEFGRDRAQ